MIAPTDAERLAGRALRLLGRPGAWLEDLGCGYAVRAGADRRRRPALRLDEAAFRQLVASPGLSPRTGGGFQLRVAAISGSGAAAPPPEPGRPGFIAGDRLVAAPEGGWARRAVNLGESPIAWLARRRDAAGRPWLDPAQVLAGERLREDMERAGVIGRLTMRWDGAPPGGGGGPRVEPVERARAAKARVAAALEAVGPGLREMLERVCLLGAALETAERELGLPRRSGKTLLKLALQRLAAHYGLA